MILALLLCLAMIPAWTFGGSLMTLAVGAFVMQAGVRAHGASFPRTSMNFRLMPSAGLCRASPTSWEF